MFIDRKRIILIGICFALSLFAAQVSLAATIIVDGSNCTLAQAITAANQPTSCGTYAGSTGADTIVLTNMPSPLSLSAALPAITSDITITGADKNIDGGGSYRIFEVGSGGKLTIDQLSLLNGSATGSNGGGILIQAGGSATLTRVAITDSSANQGGAIYNAGTLSFTGSRIANGTAAFGGGLFNSGSATIIGSTITTSDADVSNSVGGNGAGIYSSGSLTARGSTFRQNEADVSGGAIYIAGGSATIANGFLKSNTAVTGGGIYSTASLTLENSTFDQNKATGSGGGGGIYISSGSATITHVTAWESVLDDSSATGSELLVDGASAAVSLRNSILADSDSNNTTPNCGVVNGAALRQNVGNLIKTGSGNCTSTYDEPHLGSEVEGPPNYYPLEGNSEAIGIGDAGICRAYSRDVRGIRRPATACDAGAAERDGFNDIYVDSGCTLSQAIENANDNAATNAGCESGVEGSVAPDFIWLTGNVSLSAAVTNTTSKIILDGKGHRVSRATGSFRPFEIESNGDLTMRNITVEGFSVTSDGGGAVLNNGRLRLEDCVFKDNSAPGGGGAVHLNANTVVINRCAFIGNDSVNGSGGAIKSDYGDLTMTNSTFISNTCSGSGCAIFVSHSDGTTLSHNTFWDNATDTAGNISAIYSLYTLAFNNIIGNSSASSDPLCGGTFQNANSERGLLTWNGPAIDGCGTRTEANPNLGGQTGFPPYLPLGAGSAAIGAGIAAQCAAQPIDQRGAARPATGCDIGAVQYFVLPQAGDDAADDGDARTGGRWVQLADGTWKWLPHGKSLEDIQRPVCSGEELNKLGQVRVWATYGLCSGVQFKRLEAGWLTGNQRVIDAGFLDAVDVYGYAEQGVEVCFPAYGAMVLLDAAASPRSLEPLDAYLDGHLTCARFAKAGTAVLIAANSGLAAAPVAGGPSAGLANCMVTTTYVLNLRAEPNGNVIGMVAHNATLTALSRTQGWFEVDANGVTGWISADYVTTNGSCG